MQGRTESSAMQSLVQKNLEMKKMNLEYQMMLMAEQTKNEFQAKHFYQK